MKWFKRRFGESSTYTGLAVLGSVAAILAGPEGMEQAAPLVALAVGVYDVVRQEKPTQE